MIFKGCWFRLDRSLKMQLGVLTPGTMVLKIFKHVVPFDKSYLFSLIKVKESIREETLNASQKKLKDEYP